jgi:hypothetical protein
MFEKAIRNVDDMLHVGGDKAVRLDYNKALTGEL